MAGALEGDAEVVVERCHGRIDLDRAGERTERLRELPLADVHARQVVQRPHVAVIEHERLPIGADGTGGVAQFALHAAEQPEAFARPGIDLERRLDVRQRVLGLVLFDEHAAQVELTLDVGRVLLERPPERVDRPVAVSRLPRGEAEHVVPPHVVGLSGGVRREQPCRLVVPLLFECRVCLLERDRPGDDRCGGGRARRLRRDSGDFGCVRVGGLGALVAAGREDQGSDRDDGETVPHKLLLVGVRAPRKSRRRASDRLSPISHRHNRLWENARALVSGRTRNQPARCVHQDTGYSRLIACRRMIFNKLA